MTLFGYQIVVYEDQVAMINYQLLQLCKIKYACQAHKGDCISGIDRELCGPFENGLQNPEQIMIKL